jgi:predicted phosphodiesterase
MYKKNIAIKYMTKNTNTNADLNANTHLNTNISIQIFSDMHIELWDKMPIIEVKAKYLFLAGDICKINHILFYKFFDYCSTNWEKTFYIPGNHEFYSNKKNYNELNFDYYLKFKERYKNVFYLNDESVPLNENVNVYGTVLWTVPPFSTTAEAKMFINDYNYITYFNKVQNKSVGLDINFVKELSREAFTQLETYLNKTDKKTIIMTHFPPIQSGTIEPSQLEKNSILNLYSSWQDNTLDKLNLKNVFLWISGHTHWSYDFEKNGVRFISNQLGYKNELYMTTVNEEGLYKIELIA